MLPKSVHPIRLRASFRDPLYLIHQGEMQMDSFRIDLANSQFRFPDEDDRVYLKNACVSIVRMPFVIRQVSLRFEDGPQLELSVFDMDRIAIEYLKLRGVELPSSVGELASVAPPSIGSFVVPTELAREFFRRDGSGGGQDE